MKDNEHTARPIVEVRGLRKYFESTRGLLRKTVGTVKAVDDVSFTINEGETLALVGEAVAARRRPGAA